MYKKNDCCKGIINMVKGLSIKKSELLNLILVFLLTLVSNDTFMFGTNSNEAMIAIPRFLMLAFCIVSIIHLANRRVIGTHRELIFFALITGTFFLSVSVNHSPLSVAAIKIFFMCGAYFITKMICFEDYIRVFCKVMYFFAVYSLILTVLAYISPWLIYRLPVVVNTVDVKFYHALFAGLDERSMGQLCVRSGGIFWEPGVYQMYLNLAILFDLYLSKGRINRRLIIYILAVIFTFSTTGVVILIWLLGTYQLFEKTRDRKMSTNIVIYLLLLLCAFLLFWFAGSTEAGKVIFGKLTDMGHGSTMPRWASIIVNLDIAKDHPFFGIGVDVEVMRKEFIARSKVLLVKYWTRQNTNTLLSQFSTCGIFFGSLFTYASYQFGKLFTEKRMMQLSIFTWLFLMYVGENLNTSLFPFIIVFYGINADKLHKPQIDTIR